MSKSFDQSKDEIARLCQYFATNRSLRGQISRFQKSSSTIILAFLLVI